MTAIIGFLGYNPVLQGKTLLEQLIRHRTALGLSQQEAAGDIGVDEGTLEKREHGEREH